MENLIFSLNATMPIFLIVVLGYILRRIGWIEEEFAAKMNNFVFMVAIPALVFEDVATVALQEVWNLKFILFCLAATGIGIFLVTGVSYLWKDRSIQGEFIQASYRSSAALLGFAFIENIYGDTKLAPIMIIGCVPLYNIMAVVILSFFRGEQNQNKGQVVKSAVKGIVKNPIIIALALGILWSLFQLPMPNILEKTISSVGGVASPMGLMAMGASFDAKKAFEKIAPSFVATFIKLVGQVAFFLPVAVRMGFRNEELVAVLVMLGSATTVSSYVMAKNMGHEGVLTSSTVMLTTVCSAFSFTMWLFVLRCFQLI